MNLQNLVPKILASIIEERRQASAVRGATKARLEQGATELHLLCDRLKDMGVDVQSPTGKLVLAKLLRIGAMRSAIAADGGDDMPPSEIGGNW